ncbi:MAG: hypothetical protein JXM70_10580 [Pirellulales bacterium]|nr:hypothetical protein [Pirellulales bacterium]
MSQVLDNSGDVFVNRRVSTGPNPNQGSERRQFTNSHDGLSPEAQELALAIDGYKARHRRRFITYEEMLAVIKSLGYHK